jgi:hypothetical protein
MARNDEQPYVSTGAGFVRVDLPSPELSADQARQLASDIVLAALEVEHQARAKTMGPDPRYRRNDRRPRRGTLR